MQLIKRLMQRCQSLSRNWTEAIAVSIFEYNEEKHMRSEQEAGIEEGIDERGIQQGIELKLFLIVCKKLANQPILNVLAEYANRKSAACAQISLAWMLHKYPNVVPIPGSKNQKRMLENLGAWNVELTESEFLELVTALNSCTVYGHRGYVESEQKTFSNNWIKTNCQRSMFVRRQRASYF